MKTLLLFIMAFCFQCQAFNPFTSGDTPFTWNKRLFETGSITWSIPADAPAILRESVLYSIDAWTKASGNTLSFEEGPGGIVILWVKSDRDDWLGYATLTTSYTNIESVKILINAKYSWNRNPDDDGAVFGVSANLDSVMLHEMGHALGLNHTEGQPITVGGYDPRNLPTMNGTIYPGASTLHADDIAGIQFLYPAPSASEAPVVYGITAKPFNRRLTFLKMGRPIIFSTSPKKVAHWDFGDGYTASGANVVHSYRKYVRRYDDRRSRALPRTFVVTATFRDTWFQEKVVKITVEVSK